MEQVRREPLANRAAALLLDRIQTGEWPLGAKLPGETTLAPQLGVGRSTVREAIRQLAGRGVLTTRQGAGVFVTALDAPPEWDAVLRSAGIVAVLQARLAVESEASAIAAAQRTPADMRAIRRALKDRDANRDEIEAHVDTDTAFHRAVVAASHNPVLLDLFDSFVPRSRQAMMEMLRIRRSFGDVADQDVHADLSNAVANRDAAAARRLTRDHLEALVGSFGDTVS